MLIYRYLVYPFSSQGFADTREHDIIFARPLRYLKNLHELDVIIIVEFPTREFPSREVAMHVALNNLETVTIPSIATLVSVIVILHV